MKDERKYKIGEEVLIFSPLVMGNPTIEKGRVAGVQRANACIWDYRYFIETPAGLFPRFPDAIYKSVEEMGEALKDMVIE